MSTAYVLLGLLAPGAMHGYELKHAHDLRLPGTRPLACGQVYATLQRVVRDGLVAEAAQERVAGPDRTAFAVTDRGRAALDEWLAVVEPPAPFLTGTLLARVVVILLVADEATARGQLARQRAAHLARMRELTAVKTAPGARVTDVLAADLAIAHLDADLRWMQTTLERVTELYQEVHQ